MLLLLGLSSLQSLIHTVIFYLHFGMLVADLSKLSLEGHLQSLFFSVLFGQAFPESIDVFLPFCFVLHKRHLSQLSFAPISSLYNK